MLHVKAVAAPLICLLVAACAAEPPSARGQDEPRRAPSSTTSEPVPAGPTEKVTATAPPAANELALEKGISLLRNGGVREVGEAEPPHGDRDADLMGQWGRHTVIATVRRTGDPMLDWAIVDRQFIADTEVLTIRGSYSFLRFQYGEFTVDLRVIDWENLDVFLEAESQNLTSTILCPSECGDLPDGADG